MIEILSVLSLAAIAAFLLFPYNTYRVDALRQNLFAVRDELFDHARAGKISFDSSAYKATRSLLNGMIRFSHRVSFSRMLSFRLLMSDRAMKFGAEEFMHAMAKSSAADQELCGQHIVRAHVLVAKHIFSSPFVLMFVAPPVVAFVLSKIGYDLAGRTVKACRSYFLDFDSIAFREGKVS
jgi:hypothetical protein